MGKRFPITHWPRMGTGGAESAAPWVRHRNFAVRKFRSWPLAGELAG
jgi:hypothetical protein